MEACGFWEHLWLEQDPKKPSKILQLNALYVLKPNELKKFMGRL
jgi:hypothetical protein